MIIPTPKAVIAWMAALSVGFSPNDGIFPLISGLVVWRIGGCATNAMYSICVSYRVVIDWYQHASRWINSVTSFFFAVAGIGLLRSAFERSSVSQ